MPVRGLSLRPTFERKISDASMVEMASPLSTVPPPSVMDNFERNPVRRNTSPVLVNGRVYNIYKPLVTGAQNVILEGARLAGIAWRAPFQTTSTLALTGLTVWVIVLTVHLQKNRAEIDLLTSAASALMTDFDALSKAYYEAPFCDTLGLIYNNVPNNGTVAH